MAATEIICPSCGETIVVENPRIGMKIECPGCGKKAILRAAGTCQSHPASENQKTFPFSCPFCSTFAELPSQLLGSEYECKKCNGISIAKRSAERPCPHCGTRIKTDAAVCPHCKADLFKEVKEKKRRTLKNKIENIIFFSLLAAILIGFFVCICIEPPPIQKTAESMSRAKNWNEKLDILDDALARYFQKLGRKIQKNELEVTETARRIVEQNDSRGRRCVHVKLRDKIGKNKWNAYATMSDGKVFDITVEQIDDSVYVKFQ